MAINDCRKTLQNKFLASFTTHRHIAPLANLRIVFGAIMLYSTIRFICKGWIADFYVQPKFHFTFYGFSWIHPFSEIGMYTLFFLMTISSLFIMLGFFYRIAIVTFLLSFTYVELIDKTFYLNHYYFISIFSFLMILVPAHRYFSLDVLRKPSLKITQVPAWVITIFKLQLLLVYFYAGLSKLTYDWLFEAMPLKIWLPANASLPLVGYFLDKIWVAYLFSWFGAVFDLSIGFLLLKKSTRKPAYFFVVLFHVFTGWFFKIGMFPYIMICVTTIFFSEDFHIKLIKNIRSIFSKTSSENNLQLNINPLKQKVIYALLIVYFVLQLLIPFRFLLYPGKLYWTEEGYRFSWRVMLMEKGGTAFFYVKDALTGKQSEVINSHFLTPMQEKMMATQPDMILQYAHYLKDEYEKKGVHNPIVTTECYVTLNGSGSRLFIDSTVDLAKENESFLPNKWVLSFQQKNNSK
ncbi:MAG: HTTM domain-containing protein [Bacteroidia bacterium]